MNDVQKQIRDLRAAEVVLAVKDATGAPMAHQAIEVRQVRHKFLFGANLCRFGMCGEHEEGAYRHEFVRLMNYATLPFHWGQYEAVEGQPDVERLKHMAEWCRSHNIRTKGHPLVGHDGAAEWMGRKTMAELYTLQLNRIEREIKTFSGLIDAWGVLNEAVVMPDDRFPGGRLASEKGVQALVREAFERARAQAGGKTLILNDSKTGADYEAVVDAALNNGVEIDAIGIQAHMHDGYRGADWIQDVCTRFSRFKKPLHFTEITILSGQNGESTPEGEALQAKQVEACYTQLFAQPSVEAVTWGDFTDDHARQGAAAGLVRKNMTPKPAYEILRKLIKGTWWTGSLMLITNERGEAVFRGWLGHYEVKADGMHGALDLSQAGNYATSVTVSAASSKK